MGDILRRVLYPLLLPAIVFCVWANAWAVKQESGASRALPPTVTTVPPYASAPRAKPPATGYGLARDDDGFASTDDTSDAR